MILAEFMYKRDRHGNDWSCTVSEA